MSLDRPTHQSMYKMYIFNPCTRIAPSPKESRYTAAFKVRYLISKQQKDGRGSLCDAPREKWTAERPRFELFAAFLFFFFGRCVVGSISVRGKTEEEERRGSGKRLNISPKEAKMHMLVSIC